MAAAIVPLISAAAPILVPLIVSLVNKVEGLFGKKTGPAKLAAVSQATQAVASNLSAAGNLPGLLNMETIISLVEGVVQALKANGQLGEDATTTVTPPPVVEVPSTAVKVRFTGVLETLAKSLN
jgi:uncharacterized protein (DUF697 family)